MSNLGRCPDMTGYGPGFPAGHCPECERLKAEREELYREQERLRDQLARARLDAFREIAAARKEAPTGEPL